MIAQMIDMQSDSRCLVSLFFKCSDIVHVPSPEFWIADASPSARPIKTQKTGVTPIVESFVNEQSKYAAIAKTRGVRNPSIFLHAHQKM